MSSETELNSVIEAINKYEEQIAIDNMEEALLQDKIASIRLEIAQLRDRRYAVKQKLTNANKERVSLERKFELEKEAERIKQTIAEKRKEADELLKNAPWYNDAFDWQIEGAIQLPERGLLGDKRGLGKTLSSLIWRRLMKSKKTLICLRKEVAADFIKEIHYREPGLFVYPMLGANAEQRQMAAMLLNHQEEFVVVTNIESWRRNVDKTVEDILKIDYDAIILDEAHHIKNAGTGTAQGFFRLAARVPKILELTGTPIKNRPQEMFSLLHALYPELFPRETAFIRDYCMQLSQNRYVFTPQGLKSLVAKISSFYVARSPEDIGRNVPPPRMIPYELELDNHPEQKKAYEFITQRSIAMLNSGKAIPIVSQLAIMTRQAQMVSWPAGIKFNVTDFETGEFIETIEFDVFQSVKIDWAEEFIQELVGEGERVILFSRFKPAIYELKKRLVDAGLSVAVITGDEKAKRNTEEIFDDFDLKTAPENPRFQVLLATYQTVGESANLNAARHMILFDRYWNPGNDDQAIGRIDRINSIDQATVHLPFVKGTIDEYMIELIDEKRNVVTDFKSASAQQARLVAHLQKTLDNQ